MNKIKNNLRGAFTALPNDLINERGIHPTARFMYVYMASKPDNWEFNDTDLKKALNLKDSTTLRKYRNQLIDFGWITKGEQNRVAGNFSFCHYTINASPIVEKSTTVANSPIVKFSVAEKNRSGKNRLHNKKESINKKEIYSNKESTRTFPKKSNSLKSPNLKKEKNSAQKEKARPSGIGAVHEFMLEFLGESKTQYQVLPHQEAQKFMDHYSANGWKVGRSAMRDWKATARNWIRRAEERTAFRKVVKSDERFFEGMKASDNEKLKLEGFSVHEF